MITKVRETFESVYYSEEERAFISSSNIAFISLETYGERDITDQEKKEIKKLVDLFDHSSVSKNNTKFTTFITGESSRYILTSLPMSRSVYSKLLFIIIEEYLEEKYEGGDNARGQISLKEVTVTDSQDIETIVTKRDLPTWYGPHLYTISPDTFNS